MRRYPLLLIAFAALFIGLVLRANTPLQVATSTWAPAGQMSGVRAGAASVLLPDGRILVTGGMDVAGNPVATTEFFNIDGSFTPGPTMATPRAGHAAAWLVNGEVIVTGGVTTSGGTVTNSAEIFDPLNGTAWTTLPSSMLEPRTGHTITQLQDGSTLIAGGVDNSGAPVSALEVLEIAPAEHFVSAGSLQTGRKNHAAAALSDGRVVIVGGTDAGGATLASTEIYDPATKLTSAGPAMATPRSAAAATTLLDGTVLIAGGSYPEAVTQRNADGTTSQTGPAELTSVEIYDPAASTIRTASAVMTTARSGHQAFLLPNNNSVLLVGGTYNGQDLASADLYVPWTGVLKSTGAMSAGRVKATGSLMQPDGLLMVAGGNSAATAEAYGFATVKTTANDYAPGQTVTIVGAGWQPGEIVSLKLHRLTGSQPDVVRSATADAAGTIANSDYVTQTSDYGVSFVLTATGAVAEAQNTFKDANPVRNFTASIAPSTDTAGHAGSTYTITVKNDTTSNQDLGLANATVPSSYSSAVLGTVTAPAGKVWTASLVSGVIQLRSNANTNRLAPGQTVTVRVTANVPCTASSYEWTTVADQDTTKITGAPNFDLLGSQPAVSVTGSCDSTPPTTTIALTPATANGANSWYTTNVHITVSAADNTGGSGVAETRCILDPASAPANFDAIPTGCAYTGAGADVTTEGQHTVYAASKDNVGNKEGVRSNAFKIDKTAPDTQITTQPASLTKDTSATFTFTGTDNLTQANLTFQCSLDSNLDASFSACTSPKNYPTLTAGPHTFYVRAVDQAGDVDATPASFAWTIDNVAPTVTVQFTAPVHGLNGWYNKDDTASGTVTATDDSNINSLTCSDGANAISLTPSGIGTKTATASITLSSDGTHGITCTATDAATNSGQGSATVKIDTTVPALTLTFTPDTPDGLNGWWKTTGGVPFAWTCTDSGSGIDTTFNGGCPATLSGTITTQGTTTYTLQVRDQAGNLSVAVNRSLKLDNVAPTITVQLDKTAAATGWFNIATGAPTAKFTCSDATSGLAANACPADHLFGEGADQNFSGTVTDEAGNSASAKVEHVNVDITAPTLSLVFRPDSPDGLNGWWKTPGGVPFTWTCADTGTSGIDASFNGGCPATMSGTITAQGTTTYTLQVRDVAGNLSPTVDRTLKLDNVAPTISATLDKTAAATGWFNISTGAPSVKFTCSDATSGLAANACPANHEFGNGADQSFTDSVTDEAGNSASAGVQHVNVDLIAPTLTLAFTPDTPDGSNGWWKTPTGVPFAWTCTDTGSSGIDATFNGGCPVSLNGSITTQGSTTFNLQVRDVAGNSSATVNRTLKLDNIAPTITAQLDKTPDPTTAWFNISRGAPTVSFTCEDASPGSGLGANACPTSHLFSEGVNQTFSGTVSDEAGNSSSAEVKEINVDLTAPTLTLVFSPDSPDGLNGWWKTPGGVPYVWTCADATSGIDTVFAPCPTSGTDSTQGTSNFQAQVRDKAGNLSADVSRTINLDNVAPVVSLYPAADACSVPGINGWCRGTQTAGFSASDATSGLTSSSPFTQSTATNGGAISIASGSVCDAAGNCNSGINAGPYKIDSVAPTLTCGPAPTYVLSQPNATVSATLIDTLSGPLAPGTTQTASASTSNVGTTLSASITAHDEAGNSTTQSCSYSVGYKLIAFLQPWGPPGVLAFKRGSTVPLKWQYANYFGTPVDTGAMSPVPKVGVAANTCGNVPATSEVTAVDSPGASGLTYDPITFTWHYNWQTKGANLPCYWLGVQTDATKQLDLYGWTSTLGTLPLQVQIR